MSDTNDIAEPARRRAAPAKKAPRTSYADAYRDLERRVRLALPVLNGASQEDALLRIKIAADMLAGA